MSDFKFTPRVGMKTNDSYLHGIGENEDICSFGKIEHVGIDYFVLRTAKRAIFVRECDYEWIEEGDFR